MRGINTRFSRFYLLVIEFKYSWLGLAKGLNYDDDINRQYIVVIQSGGARQFVLAGRKAVQPISLQHVNIFFGAVRPIFLVNSQI